MVGFGVSCVKNFAFATTNLVNFGRLTVCLWGPCCATYAVHSTRAAGPCVLSGAAAQHEVSLLTQHSVAAEQILQLDSSLSHCKIYLQSVEFRELVPVSLFQFAFQHHVGLTIRCKTRKINALLNCLLSLLVLVSTRRF